MKKGQKHSKETKEKLAKIQRAAWLRPGYRENQEQKAGGWKHTAAAKEKICRASNKLWKKKSHRTLVLGALHSESAKKKRRKFLATAWDNPEIRAKRVAGIKRAMTEEKKAFLRSLYKDKPLSEAHKKAIGDANRGENGPGWRGGVSTPNQIARASARYRAWRMRVFKRDHFTCQFCGAYGVKIHADHIKPFCTYKKLRFEVGNGRTLCVPCHKSTDTYGRVAIYA